MAWTRGPAVRDLLAHLAPPLALLLAGLVLYPRVAQFEFDKDEGVNLIKALLVERGYPLYRTVWSDQPPLLTHALALVFRVFGADIAAARYVVLCSSCMLLWAAGTVMRAVGGPVHAWLAWAFILLLPHYAQLSISVMVGLPAIALAMVALAALVLWHEKRAPVWLVVSAVALGLSVLTKFFTALLAPILVAGLLVDEFGRAGQTARPRLLWLRPAICWGLITLGVLGVGLGAGSRPIDVPQLLGTHVSARGLREFQALSIGSEFGRTAVHYGLAACSTALIVHRRRWAALYLVAWLVTCYLALASHAPVWYHQQLLVTIPAAMLSAYALVEGARLLLASLRAGGRVLGTIPLRWLLVAGIAVGTAFWVPYMVRQADLPALRATIAPSQPTSEERLVAEMAKHAPRTRWVVTDRPVYAFRAGLSVPPNLSVITRTRLATGALTEEELLETIRRERPEQVLLIRFKWPLVQPYLDEHYRLVMNESGRALYVSDAVTE